MIIGRTWAMPNKNTFDIKPIAELLRRYVLSTESWVDPFAKDNKWAVYTNDLDPETSAESHMDALAYLQGAASGSFDGALFLSLGCSRNCSEWVAEVLREMSDGQLEVVHLT